MESEILRVERLTFVHTLDLNPYMLRAYRDAIVPSASTVRRKIFISRANANYRRLENEADVERLVAAYGYEIVRLEELTFAAQLRLFSEAKVVLSLHGAGLANIIYSPTSTHVVEIIDPSFPNPEYFDLATAMGHFYWMVKGSPVGEPRPGYHDIRVDVSDLEQTLTQVSDKAGETSEIGT